MTFPLKHHPPDIPCSPAVLVPRNVVSKSEGHLRRDTIRHLSDSSKDAGEIQILVDRLEKQKLPRVLSMKEKVDAGQVLDEYDIGFLEQAFRDANTVMPLIDGHPEMVDRPEWFAPFMRLGTDEGLAITDEEDDAEFWMNAVTPALAQMHGFRLERRQLPPSDLTGSSVIRTTPKVGRNAPCPCGSGKKYKKCCGAGGNTLH